jgi:imidazole glycerol phosphate synthase subunit HisF
MICTKFGSQCVLAIDAKQIDGQWIVQVGGKVPTELNLFDWAKVELVQVRYYSPRWIMELKWFCK